MLSPGTDQKDVRPRPVTISIGIEPIEESVEPKIYFIPDEISYSINDWKLEHKNQIKISVYNPSLCHITLASIKLSVPKGWSLIPDTSSDVINYDPDESTFWIEDWGNSSQITAESWFEIKPGPHTLADKYEIPANIFIVFKNINLDFEYSKYFSKLINITVIDDSPKSNILQKLQANAWFFAMISAACALAGIYITFLRKKEKSRKDFKQVEKKKQDTN
jgi:hypothetical protein